MFANFQVTNKRFLKDGVMPSIFPWNSPKSPKESSPSYPKHNPTNSPSVVSSSEESASIPIAKTAVELDVGRDDYVYVAESIDEVDRDVEGRADDLSGESEWNEDYDPRPQKYRNWAGYADHVYNATIKFCAESGMDIPIRHAFLRDKEHVSVEEECSLNMRVWSE